MAADGTKAVLIYSCLRILQGAPQRFFARRSVCETGGAVWFWPPPHASADAAAGRPRLMC